MRLRVLHIIMGAVLLYVLFIVLSDVDEVAHALFSFPPHLFVLMLVLALCNYILRFAKWHYYLGVIGERVSLGVSLHVFLCGFSMTLTPGKGGELIKPYLLKGHGCEVGRTAPVVFAERLTDLVGMVVLVLIGYSSYGYGLAPIVAVLGAVMLVVVAIQSKRVSSLMLSIAMRLPLLRRHREVLELVHASSKILTHPVPLAVGTLMSAFSWLFECMCLYVALMGLGVGVPVLSAVFMFAFSSIAGIVAMLPGGLGATEGVMVLLLTNSGVALSDATSATLLSRAATLWFAVALGLGALTLYRDEKL